MAKLSIKKASADVTVYVFIQSSTGAGITDLVYNSANLICYYVRPLGSATQLALATQTVTGAHSDGGFVEVSKSYLPGIYRLDLSDAICATGVNSVVLMLTGATGMLPVALEIQLTDFDLNSALTITGIADAVWDETTADHTTGTTFGALDVNVNAIKSKTDNLPVDPADESTLEGLIAALPQGSDYTQARAINLDYLDALVSTRAPSGEGVSSWTYTLTDQSSQPIPYATVWVSTDAGGTAIMASGQTNAAGQVTFLINTGTYYVWRKKRGYRFTNPDVEVIV